MGPKLLFIFGIVVAHGALAAGWMAQEAPKHRAAVVSTCARTPPARPLHIAPPKELLAYAVTPVSADNEVLRP
jgi:hypothetical protein